MTFSVSSANITKADIAAIEFTPQGGAEQSSVDLFHAALRAAQGIADAFAPDTHVNVAISGHANPDHGPGGDRGYSDEFVQVSVYAIPVENKVDPAGDALPPNEANIIPHGGMEAYLGAVSAASGSVSQGFGETMTGGIPK